MKTVFKGSELVDVFASQSQDQGRTANRSIYFTGNTMYSYGSHYTVARILTQGIALVNNEESSVTTNKHTHNTFHALRDAGRVSMKVENVEAITVADHSANIADMIIRKDASIAASERARSERMIESHLNSADELSMQIEAYRKYVANL